MENVPGYPSPGTYDVARAAWCADYNEPSSFLNMMLSNSSNNTTHYKSSVFDKLIEDTLKVKSEKERADLYQQAEIQLDKDSAIVPVFYYVSAFSETLCWRLHG